MASFSLRGLATIAAAVLLSSASHAVAAPTCGTSPPGNGTGYAPPANTTSLPTGTQRPGPDILYRPLADAPQLENTGVWHAAPIMVSGTTAYRQHEFLYQDWLYDDRALATPAAQVPQGNGQTGYPAGDKYAGANAADIVEVRLKPTGSELAIRITYNSMTDPDAVAATIALGGSPEAYPIPHNAGAKEPGEVFVTAHGCSGDIVDAASGHELAIRPVVSTDLQRRQVEIEVPHEAFDARGDDAVRVAAAAGLWDTTTGQYLRPDPAKPAFFNVAFRKYGEWKQNTWMDDSQNAALAAGDLSPLFAEVDLGKLARGVDEDTVPRSGPMDRIMVSHFEPTQGRGNDQTEPDITSPGGNCSSTSCTGPCELPQCTPTYSGRLEPYAVYVPDAPPPPGGYGLVFSLHGASSNYNHFEGGGPTPVLKTWQMWAEAGRPSIFIQANARGPHLFYQGLAAVDEFEAWADAAGRFPLDPRHVILTGTSMGGYGTYKLGTTYPDLFEAIMPNVPAVGSAASKHSPFLTAALGAPDPVWLSLLANLRNDPVIQTAGLEDPLAPFDNTLAMATALQQLGYRQDAWWFAGNHEEYRYWIEDAYRELSQHAAIDPDPSHVTYVLNAGWDEPDDLGLDVDHVYWLSGLQRRDTTQQTGKIDVLSHGFGAGDPAPAPVTHSAGTSINGSAQWIRQSQDWGPAPVAPRDNDLTINATNIASATIDVDRAHVGCDAKLDVTSDGPLEIRLIGRACRSTSSF